MNSGDLKCHRIQTAIRVSEKQLHDYLDVTEIEVPQKLAVTARHF